MRTVVVTQFAVAVLVAVIAGALGGSHAWWSALMGGLSCAVPNALFALRLFASARKPGGATPAVFFIGEFAKIFSTIALMGAVVWWYRDLHWPAFVAAVVAVLNGYLILLHRVRS